MCSNLLTGNPQAKLELLVEIFSRQNRDFFILAFCPKMKRWRTIIE